ncbi:MULTISPECIES: ribonuclease J [Hyphomonas]|uniref:Metallo-beta-lactamase family protein n=2 Tax=Hyphomonas adhaerens TaxID=81029 RepID=A0A069E6U7_9PROT|nr:MULTISPECIES: ribonuclease J [Hyphomonas]KCZ83367.1 metallo-beta-lactamase family protein [Hyphomonas adhaerens MHS-3]MBB38621.1 MBL fold metallo-hydrolase [Hyphomonas sp.]HAE26816.1 MBL fold metallo-hydrolase [Hyphomonas adhaerens]|tara:strand:- start:5553 stop:7241 length:1689 start_codon:yes stop_codon:yes gene_type:complete
MSDTAHSKDELVFLPLGGCGEIGMNLNAYGYGPPHARRWILADLGVTFGSDDEPGIDLICADPDYLIGEHIDAVFLTHAHEDHIGAVGLIYPRLQINAPIYATPFTAELVRSKMEERGVDTAALKTISMGSKVQAGPFEVTYVTLTHSIPEPNALAIRTPAGIVLHTGDWKIDPDPQIGSATDVSGLTALGDEGVLAMVCDSTNVFEEGEAGSEETVRQGLVELIAEQKTGAVAVTTFASNVARVKSIIDAAMQADRHVCLVGRSMHKITNAAKAVGILPPNLEFVDESEAGHFPPEHILYLCTGSQGEPRAALSRIARGDHRHVILREGDTVIFSSRQIPGNEKGIFALQNGLADKGIRVITPRMVPQKIHVSGHPCRDELRRMYQWVRPRISVPVHGERRHIMEHAAYARSLQVPEAITPRNGSLVRLAPGAAEILDEVPNGRLVLDGNQLVPEGAQGIQERRKLSWNGVLFASVSLDEQGNVVDGPVVVAKGFSEPDGRLADESLETLEEAADIAISGLKRKNRFDDDAVERAIGRALRKAAETAYGRRPMIEVVVLRT